MQFRSEAMRNVCAIVIVIMLVAVPLSLWPQNAPDGAQIYKDRCASCHGAKGEGLTAVKIPPVKGTSMTNEKIIDLIAKGLGGKTVHATPIVNLNDGEIKAVAKYVKSLK
jgi:mono/diheme cytochrome c family protein